MKSAEYAHKVTPGFTIFCLNQDEIKEAVFLYVKGRKPTEGEKKRLSGFGGTSTLTIADLPPTVTDIVEEVPNGGD